MRPSFHYVAPDRIQIRQGGGFLAILGLPFFAAGVLALLAASGVVWRPGGGGSGDVLLPLLGLLFVTLGGGLCFGRAWSTVDGTRREVVKQWGLIVPMHAATRTVDGYNAVLVELVKGDSDSADKFPVSLKARAGQNLALCSSTEYGGSRACAIAVAELLRFDVEDRTTHHPVRLPASQAAMPLQQRLQGMESDSIGRPTGTRSAVHNDQDSVRIVIPIPRAHWLWIAGSLIPLTVVVMLVSPLNSLFEQTPDPVARLFVTVLILFFGLFPALTVVHGVLRSRRGGTIVTASSRGLSIQERGAWRAGPVTTMAAADIVDIDFTTAASALSSAREAVEQRVRSSAGGSGSTSRKIDPRTERVLTALSLLVNAGGITVKTRHGLTTFGQGLSDDEIRYLHSIVRRALTGDLAA